MRKILSLLLMIPVFGFAQTASKYLAGAVPVVDGKVVFTQTINVPGISKDALYNMVDNWAKEQFETTNDFPNNKLITENAEEGMVAAIGEEYIIFSSSMLSLDRSRIYYQFIAQCEEGKCDLTMTRIRYWYDEARDGGERYNAEEIITDENGLNKDKTKLARVIGKFRSKTIDYKDDLFKSVATSITEQLQNPLAATPQSKEETAKQKEQAAPSVITIDASKGFATPKVTTTTSAVSTAASAIGNAASAATGAVASVATSAVQAVATESTTAAATVATTVKEATPVVTESAPVVAAPIASPANPMEGYRQINPENIPGNIYKMLSQDWMLITAGNDTQFNMMTASWGGLGSLYNKPVAFCFINPARYTYQLMEKNDTYTLTFYNESSREALNVCGSTSGRDTDKVKASGLTPITTPNGSKAFKEAWLIIECKKMVAQSLNPEALQYDDLKENWAGKAMHKMYIGEIVNIWMK